MVRGVGGATYSGELSGKREAKRIGDGIIRRKYDEEEEEEEDGGMGKMLTIIVRIIFVISCTPPPAKFKLTPWRT